VKIQLFQSGNILLDTVVKGDFIDYKYLPPKIDGFYPLTLLTTSGNQCKGESRTEVNVYSSPPVSILDLKSNLCVATDKIELKANPTGGKFSGSGVIDLLNGKYQLPIGTGISNRWIYYDYTDSGGCKGRDSIFLKELKQSPTLLFENLIPSYCKSDKWIEFKVKPTGGLFINRNGPVVESVNKEIGLYRFKPLTSGEFAISYRYSDNSGCLDSLDWKYSVSDKFPFDPAVDTFILSGQKLIIGKPPVPGFSYRWFDGSTQSTYAVEDPGIYTLEVFNVASGCSVMDTVKVSFGGVNSVKESLQKLSLLEVYPNPCSDYLYLRNKNIDKHQAKYPLIRVLDVYGKVLKTVELSDFDGEIMLDVSSLPSGMYFIEGYGKTQRIIKI
ncbi:MAG: T9SS type A sorting domain-containing protein, partial [Bacteroidota bacterium]